MLQRILALSAAVGGDFLVLALALVAAYAGFTAEEPTAYVFPRLVAVLMVVFCAINVIRLALNGFAKAPVLTLPLLQKIAPGVALIWIYVLLAEDLGFYASAWSAFFLIALLYSTPRRLLLTMGISSIFVAVLYLMFSISLHVQVPAGLLL